MDTLIIIGLPLALAVVAIIVAIIVAKAINGRDTPAADPADSFRATDLLNASEVKLLSALESITRDVFGPEARVFAQVSYGEFLKGSTPSAHARINQKRADFVIANPAQTVICVAEYQGSGHYGRSHASRARAEASDAMKRKALESAGIAMLEVPAKYTERQLRSHLAEILLFYKKRDAVSDMVPLV